MKQPTINPPARVLKKAVSAGKSFTKNMLVTANSIPIKQSASPAFG
jgi:hypothetical protein